MRYRFGRYELRGETRELLADGQARAVEPQVFDLLQYLIDRRERVVTQDELIVAIWNRRVVSDSAISARISAARAALDDDGARQQWIKTVPRRGFRFVGEVQPLPGPPSLSDASAEQAADTRPAASASASASAPPGTVVRQRVAFCRSADGTRIAYAHRHPQRVSHLVLQGGYEKGRLLRDNESERAQGEAILTLIRHGWGRPGSAFIRAFSSMFVPAADREQVDSLVDLQRRTTSPENAARLRAAVDRFDVSGLVGQIAVPTLVIHSRDDCIQPLEQGRQLASRIARAEFLMLDSGNHIVLANEPAATVLFRELDRFVLGVHG